MKRQAGMVVLAVVAGSVFGTVLSSSLRGVFPEGVAQRFFFEAVQFGIPAVVVKLGLINITFGLSLSITTFTVFLVMFFVWLVGRL